MVGRLVGGRQEVLANVPQIILNKAIFKQEDRNSTKIICIKVLVASVMRRKRMSGIQMEKRQASVDCLIYSCYHS